MLYPEKEFHPKFTKPPIVKPLVSAKSVFKDVNYTRFGTNLGPRTPIMPRNKYSNVNIFQQSSAFRAKKAKPDFSNNYILQHENYSKD